MIEELREFALKHPKALTCITGLLVAFNAWSLYRSVKLHLMAQGVVGEIQRAASEALGG